MQLQKEVNLTLNTVTAYGNDYIEINETRHTHSIYFMPEGQIHELPVQTPSDFTTETLQTLTGIRTVASDPLAFLEGDVVSLENPEQIEVVLLGTGRQQHFLATETTRQLLTLGIGVEVMDTQAAARTYNILMSEGRRVVAALII